MEMIKEGIVKTIPESLVNEHRAAGWDEVKAPAPEPPVEVEQPNEKPKRGRRAAK